MKIYYEKFKDLGKDIRSFPSLVFRVVFVVVIAVLAGYIFFVANKPDDKSSEVIAPGAGDKIVVGDEGDGVVQTQIQTQEQLSGETKTALDSGDVKVLGRSDLKTFEVWNGSVKAGEIKREAPSQVGIFRTINDNMYLGVSKDGLGGYILFGGPDEIYQLDRKKNSLVKIFDRDMFVSDISSDGKKLISLESYYVKYDLFTFVNVYDLDTYESESFQIPVKYKTAGNAFFSKDGKKVVYEAAVSNPENEEFAMFVIDLATGEQKQVGGSESYEKAQEWAKNN